MLHFSAFHFSVAQSALSETKPGLSTKFHGPESAVVPFYMQRISGTVSLIFNANHETLWPINLI